MSRRGLLDLITVLNASRNVAKKHIALQRKHLDVHARTSSVTKELKAQADRISVAVQAASDLARKLDDDAPTATTRDATAWTATAAGATENGKSVPQNINTESAQRMKSDTLDEPIPQEKSHETSAELEPSTLRVISQTADKSEASDAPRNNPTTDSPEEPSQDVVQDLFRSRRVAKTLLDGQKYGSYRESYARPTETTPIPRIRTVIDSVPTLSQTEADPLSAPDPVQSTSAEAVSGGTFSEPNSADDVLSASINDGISIEAEQRARHQMIESRVPSSRLGRLWEYGGLAASMAFGVVGESIRRSSGQNDAKGSLLLSPGNIERLVNKLSKMRGAALKLGQMMSFQDSKMLPSTIQEVLQRVQDRANYMPPYQRDKVMSDNLGPEWRALFESFDEIPIAAASIGQVHSAVLRETGQRVAVKVQYPGVADSIDSDLNNLSILLTASRLLPKGLFLDKTIANARTELSWECDYIREAECGRRFKQLLADDPIFVVPEIIPQASGAQVLTMELLDGVAVTRIANFTQAQRDWIGTQIMRLCFREICEFRYMQTDPNWTNFLYNAATGKLELLDFGASRAYPTSFMNTYIRVLVAASRNDRETCRDLSVDLGYLTGYESQAMIDAHVSSILTLAEPFMTSSPEVYDFSDQTITDRVRDQIPLMLRERLAPPPEETYSLHRKLSGAFLLCARLGSRVRCRDIFDEAVQKVDWDATDSPETGGESRGSETSASATA